jgi:regulator of protease activity HflC (stomatin/prohibitin superfamily)
VGVIHQLPIEFLLPTGNGSTVSDEPEERVGAEAVPPPGADRLWDGDHPFEGSYLIASEENGQQSFQLVDVDMAVIYQIGRSDDAARNAAYRIDGPDELIQALSGQILVRYLSENTLLDLLGKSRETFSTDFQAALQKQLDGLSAGIEVLAISVEAIHPPPAAASAYHDVQAAEIRATAQISYSRGDAASTVKMAEQRALEDRNEGLAAAAKLVGEAQTSAVLFGGDRQAFGKNGKAFLFERWFGNLTRALGESEFVIIDHRLRGQEVPTLDLRSFRQLPPNEGGLSSDAGAEVRRLPPPDDEDR